MWSWTEAYCNALADALAANLEDGEGAFFTSAPAEICRFEFTGAFDPASGGSADHDSMTVAENDTGDPQTIASLRVYESDGTTEVGRSAVGTIGSEEGVELTSLTLADSETVQLTLFTISVGPVT